MFRSIRVKFTSWFIGSFLVMLILSFMATEIPYRLFTIHTVDAALYKGARHLEQALFDILPPARDKERAELNEFMDRRIRELFPRDIVYAQVLKFPENADTGPEVVARTYTLRDRALPLSGEVYRAAMNNSPRFESIRDPGTHFQKSELRLLTLPIHDADREPYVLQFGVDVSEHPALLGSDNRGVSRDGIFSVVMTAGLIAIAWLGSFFMRRAFAPIHRIVTLAKRITAEDLSHRIDSVNSKDEIGELADTLNEMIARLERSFRQIKQFSADVSHELRTPLTAIKGELEVALRKERNVEEYKETMAGVLEKAGQLENIIADLLFLARMDAQSIPLSFMEFRLDKLMLEVHEETYRSAERKRITFNLKGIEQASLMGDPGLLKRALLNLVENAIKYTEPGGRIELSLERESDTAVCMLRDSGIGIPAESLPYIFDRFYRVDRSRSHDTGGSGLGLAIVQKIVEAHQGRIDVESEAGKGTAFRVSLNAVS